MPFKHNAARRHRIPQARYRVQNWPAYEAGLKRRGDLTLWLDEAALAGWQAPRRTTPGGQAWYSDAAIELVLISTLHVSARSRNAKPLISLKPHSRNGLSPRPGDDAESGETRPCRGLARNPRCNRLSLRGSREPANGLRPEWDVQSRAQRPGVPKNAAMVWEPSASIRPLD